MANQRILAIVTALLMLGSTASAQQVVSITDLRKIEQLVSTQNWTALYTLIQANPALTQGADPLSTELCAFARQISSGRIAALAPAQSSIAGVCQPEEVSRVSLAAIDDIY